MGHHVAVIGHGHHAAEGTALVGPGDRLWQVEGFDGIVWPIDRVKEPRQSRAILGPVMMDLKGPSRDHGSRFPGKLL